MQRIITEYRQQGTRHLKKREEFELRSRQESCMGYANRTVQSLQYIITKITCNK